MSDENEAPAGEGGTPEGGGSEAAPEPRWYESITDAKERRFAEGYESPADVNRAALALRQKLSNAVVRPGKNASEDDIKAWRKGIGVPETHEGYKLNIPPELAADEAGLANLAGYLKRMHDAGTPPGGVQAGLDSFHELSARVAEQQAVDADIAERAAEERLAATQSLLTREWGEAYERNVASAQRGAREFGGDEFAEFLENTEVGGVKLGEHPVFLRAFAEIGKRVGEGGFEVPTDGFGGMGAANAQERINAIHALDISNPQAYAEAQPELQALYKQLHGDGDIVGAGGRNL